MASMQMTTGLSEQETGLFGGLFSAAVEGDGDAGQFSETLQQTLAAFNQAMAEGEEISADWLQTLQQQLGDEADLNTLLAKLGLSLPTDESEQTESNLKQMLTKPDNGIDLDPESGPVTDENGNVKAQGAFEQPVTSDSPDNMLSLLAWSEKTLQRQGTDLDAVEVELADTSLPLADNEQVVTVDSNGAGVALGEENLAAEENDGLIKSIADVDWAMAEASDPNADADTASVGSVNLMENSDLSAKQAAGNIDDLTANVLPHGGGFLGTPVNAEQLAPDELTVDEVVGMDATAAVKTAAVFSDSAFNQQQGRTNKTAPAELTSTLSMNASGENGDESKQALFEALSSSADETTLDGDADPLSAPIAKAVLNSELGARMAEPSASAFASTPTATGAERIDVGTTTGQNQQANQQAPVQQARADIQTLLQQAVDIRQQEQAAGQLRERMMLMVAGRLNRAEIRLDPPELGSMMVRVQVQNEQAHVQIVTQNQQAKEMLEQTLPRLRELLQQQGIALGDTEVSQQQSQQQQMEESERDPALAWEQAQDEMLEAEIDIPVIQRQIAQGRVDYFA